MVRALNSAPGPTRSRKWLTVPLTTALEVLTECLRVLVLSFTRELLLARVYSNTCGLVTALEVLKDRLRYLVHLLDRKLLFV